MSPFSTAITTDTDNKNVTFTPLLETSEGAYLRGSVKSESDLQPTGDEAEQAYDVGVKAVRSDGGGTALVYSSIYIFNDNANQMVSGSNLNLFTGSVSAVVSTESSISIPVKEYADASLTIPAGTSMVLILVFVILIPVALLACGLVIWLRRRKR